jgi:hypothetical protein
MGEERKVGENFDADNASDIFDKLKNVDQVFISNEKGYMLKVEYH